MSGTPKPSRQRDPRREQEDEEWGDSLWTLYLLFAFSGFAALIYQVMWMRSFGLLFGSTTRAASIVLASFFFGMALGNWFGGRWTRSRKAALLAYAIAEGAIAAGALLVLPWLEFYQSYYPSLYQAGLGVSSLTALQMMLGFVAMAPPCIAMGATLPLISHAIVARTQHMGRRVGAIYALNTAGATAGALMSGFFLPLWLGTRNTILLAALISAGSGAVAFWLWHRSSSVEENSTPETTPFLAPAPGTSETRTSESRTLLLFAAISGFGTLALEVFYTRLLLNFVDASVYTFALVLAIFLVSLAIGSTLVSLLADRLRASPWSLTAWASAGGAVAVMASPSVFEWVWVNIPPPITTTEWGYMAWLCEVAFIIVAPGVILLGMILPSIWNITRDVRTTGRHIGRLTAANTLAAVAGSLAAGFLIIPQLGVARGIVLIGASYGCLAALAIPRIGSGRSWLRVGTLIACLAWVWTQQPSQLIPIHLAPDESLVEFYEGESGSVAVTRQSDALIMRMNNLYVLGSTGQGLAVRRSLGRLGLLLHPDPRDVAFLGVATGISISPVRDFPKLEHVLAMEIVPGVLEAVGAFESANWGILNDPRVSIVMADGRNHLFGTDETFDVVIADLFVPWQAGVGYLYSAEHFEIVHQRLNPGGLFVVWIHASQVSTEELRIIAGTFADEFEHTELWLNRVREHWPLVALIGRRAGGAVDSEVGDSLVRLPTRPSCGPYLVRKISSADPLFQAAQCMGGGEAIRRWTLDAPRNTDDHPIIEFRSGLGHFGLPGSGELTLMLKEIARLDSAGSESSTP